jgi:hypothetical protein
LDSWGLLDGLHAWGVLGGLRFRGVQPRRRLAVSCGKREANSDACDDVDWNCNGRVGMYVGRYKLVPEGEGRELDMPAARCRQVLAYAVSKTNNADKEVWDIVLPEEQEEYELVRN